jgi:hypothetical protein
MPVYVHSGTLAFGDNGGIANNHTLAGDFLYYKQGPGDWDVRNVSFALGTKPDFRVSLQRGGLVADSASQLASGTVQLNDLFGANDANSRAIKIYGADLTLATYSSGAFGMNIVVEVESGRTFTIAGANRLVPKEIGPNTTGLSWGIEKLGGGVWLYNSSSADADSGRTDAYVKSSAGTFDVNGNMGGRTALWLDGGTILAGNAAKTPFLAQRLWVTSGGGKIGVSVNANGNVTRSAAFDGTNNKWDLGGLGTLTMASRDNLDLVWGMAAFPNIASGETVLIERDGIGTGVVQINDTTWTVSGTIGGSATLKLGSSGTGTLTADGTVAPGGTTTGTLTVQGNVTAAAGTIWDIELGIPSASDRLDVTSNLTLGGTLNVSNTGTMLEGTYTIMTYGGSLSGSVTLGSVPAGADVTLDTSVPGEVRLTVVNTAAKGTVFIVN